MTRDPTELCASELAELIAGRVLSALEATTSYLERIEERNPRLNAVVHLDSERAIASARRLDARKATVGPLHGVPMTLKESHRVASFPLDVGDPDASSAVSRSDGEVAARLRAAGAILMGTTNVARGLGDFQTDNPVHGRTNNPIDVGRTPGGSSGGAAAALADRLAALEVGSDIAGSLRIPAAFTGVFSLMPTASTVPTRGHVAEPTHHPRGGGVGAIATIGPMARAVPDLRLLMSALTGSDWRRRTIRGPSIGLIVGLPGLRVQRSIRDAVTMVGASAERRGARVEVADVPRTMDAQHRAFVLRYQAAQRYGATWRQAQPSAVTAQVDAAREWHALLQRHKAIIMPVAMTTAFTHRPTGTPIDVDGTATPYWGLTRYTEPFNLAGLPVLVFPAGHDRDGLPIGLQLVAAPGRGAWLISLAEWLVQGLPDQVSEAGTPRWGDPGP